MIFVLFVVVIYFQDAFACYGITGHYASDAQNACIREHASRRFSSDVA
jgi:hypothetical protein